MYTKEEWLQAAKDRHWTVKTTIVLCVGLICLTIVLSILIITKANLRAKGLQ